MARFPSVSWIGNAAAVLAGKWGAVSLQAQTAGCSRQAAYDHAEKVEAAVRAAPSRDHLREQVRQQAERLATLEKRLARATEFPEQEQQRFAATATAMGLSYAQARELLEIGVKKKLPVARRSGGG